MLQFLPDIRHQVPLLPQAVEEDNSRLGQQAYQKPYPHIHQKLHFQSLSLRFDQV